MSLLGVDIGTTGCKAAVFSEEGICLTQAYREYGIHRPGPGLAELDSREVWSKTREVAAATGHDLRCGGGGAKSNAWLQIKSDIFGVPIIRPRLTNGNLLGAALLAGIATDAFDGVAEGVTRLREKRPRFRTEFRATSDLPGQAGDLPSTSSPPPFAPAETLKTLLNPPCPGAHPDAAWPMPDPRS